MHIADLIAQIESASQPSRELDRKIHATIGASPVPRNQSIPFYTQSVDTALTLIPDGEDFYTEKARGIRKADGRSFSAMIGRHRSWGVRLPWRSQPRA